MSARYRACEVDGAHDTNDAGGSATAALRMRRKPWYGEVMSNHLSLPPSRGVPAPVDGAHYPTRFEGDPGGGASPEAGIRRYLAAILRYRWMVLLILLVGTGAGLYAASKQTLLYQTTARVWIGAGLAGGEVGTPIQQGALLGSAGWSQLIVSSTVMDSVVRQHRLYVTPARIADSVAFTTFGLDADFRPGAYSLQVSADRRSYELAESSGRIVDRGAVGEPIGASVGFRWNPSPAALPASRPLEFVVQQPRSVAQGLRNQLQAPDPRNDNFMNVSLRGPDPDRITHVLTAVVARFEQVSLELKSHRLAEHAAILNTQLRAAEERLASAENELESYKVATITLPTEMGVPVNPGLQSTDPTARGNYWRLTTEKDLFSRDRAAILRAIGNRDADRDIVTALEMIPSVRQSSELTSALSEAATTDAALRALKVQLTDQHPQVIAEQQRLDSLRNYVIPTYARQVVDQLSKEETAVDDMIGVAAGELRQIPERFIQEMKLQRHADIVGDLYRRLEGQHQQARLAEVTAQPDIQILDWPSVPFTPVEDRRVRVLLLAMGASLGLAIAGAILRDRFDPRLRYPDEVTAGMGLFILGAVPALRRGKLGATDMALAVESFRAIQLSILHAHGEQGPLVVTLTSPGASDGKSFVTSNLAIAFADMGHRTIIIDGDVRRGTIHQLMGNTHKPGLTDHLAGHARRDQIVQRTRYTLLDMIGCGSRGEAGPKLLGSSAMARLIEELRKDYDVILVDSPPLGACADPMILGTLTRNLILVLRTGTTDRVMAESKLQILDRMPVRVLGAVLNDVPARGPYRYYSYIAGYEVLDDGPTGQEVGSLPGGSRSA